MPDASHAPHTSVAHGTERSRMRALRLLTVVAALGLLGTGVVACSTTVNGKGSLAEGVVTPGPTDSASPTATPTSSPTGSPTESPSTTVSPSPTIDPVKTKERVTCVLVQATVKTTNDKFNAAKTRPTQIQVLKSASIQVDGTLKRSGLPPSDRIFLLGRAILLELRKIVQAAEHGGNPSTGPYNTLTTRFRTACLDI
jgi:hypothetical protein